MGCPLSFDVYSSRFPGSCYSSYLEKLALKPLFQRIQELYVSRKYKWIEQLQNGFFVTMNLKKPQFFSENEKKYYQRTYPLCDNDLFLHLKQEKTVGIFPNAHFSKFLIFDIDSLDFSLVREVYFHIAQYFPEKFINISFSGTKGYHIALFFEKEIPRNMLQLFFNLIISELNLDNEEIIECRGGLAEMAVKLPLGYNYSAKNEQEGLTYFVDINASKLPTDYIFQIQKIPVRDFEDVMDINIKYYSKTITPFEKIDHKKLNDKKNLHFAISQQEFIDICKKNGISEKGKRHKIMFQIAISLKLEGFSEIQAQEYLRDWHNKLDADVYSSSDKEIEMDIKHTVKNVFKNSHYSLQKNKYIKLNKMEIEEILSVKNSVLRHLYFILFCQAKAYGCHGNFSMTYQQMAIGGITKNRARVKLQLLELQKLGKIKIVQCNKFKELHERQSNTDWKHPNLYRLLCFQEKLINQDNVQYKLNVDNLHSNFLEFISRKVFIPAELKQFYNKNQITKIKQLEENYIEFSKVELDMLEVQEINSVDNMQLKVLYLALILNSKYECKKSVNIFDFSGVYRVFGVQKNKSMTDYLQLFKQLESLGKIKILNYSRFFFKYELVRFSEIKFNAKSNVNILEKFKS